MALAFQARNLGSIPSIATTYFSLSPLFLLCLLKPASYYTLSSKSLQHLGNVN